MSHISIFQLSKSKLSEEDFYTKEDYYARNPEFGDKCNGDTYNEIRSDDRKREIEGLIKVLGDSAEIKNECVVFKDIRDYFDEKFLRFLKHIRTIDNEWTVVDFMNEETVADMMMNLQREVNNLRGFWVCTDDMLFLTLDEFMHNVKDGESYYMGSIIDCHI